MLLQLLSYFSKVIAITDYILIVLTDNKSWFKVIKFQSGSEKISKLKSRNQVNNFLNKLRKILIFTKMRIFFCTYYRNISNWKYFYTFLKFKIWRLKTITDLIYWWTFRLLFISFGKQNWQCGMNQTLS